MDEPLWEKHYRSDPRSRFYALTDAAKRGLKDLWFGCGQKKDDFLYAIHTFTNAYGMNLVRQIARAKPELPKPRLDSLGHELPNPWITKNRKDQRALLESDPAMAAHLRALAENPWTYQLELDQKEASRLRWNKINDEYLDDANPLKKGDKIRLDFMAQAQENSELAEKLEIFQRELAPVDFGNLFASRPEQTPRARTIEHAIWHDGDVRLQRIVRAAQAARAAADLIAHEKAEAQRAQDVRDHERQRRAHDDLMKGVKRLGDGRIVTMPG